MGFRWEWGRVAGKTSHIEIVAMILCGSGSGRTGMSSIIEFSHIEASATGLQGEEEGRVLSSVNGILHMWERGVTVSSAVRKELWPCVGHDSRAQTRNSC